MVRGVRPPFRHQLVAAAVADRSGHFGLRVMNVAEQSRAGRARHHARRFALRLRQLGVVNAVDAQRALLHHLLVRVELARAVRARPRAILAADALIVIDQHDAVFGTLVARAGRAYRHAWRVFAVQARLGEMHGFRIGKLADLECLYAVEECSRGVLVVRAVIGQVTGEARSIPLLAARHARVAANANVEIDDERELGHWYTREW